MPGKKSLAEQQYYAHPQNLFWPFMSINPELAYAQRLSFLTENRIALWDVLKQCVRASSLDSDIVEATIIPNDFAEFFAANPTVRHIFFNGSKAEQAFKRYALPRLANAEYLSFTRLPSTSPANASIARDIKLEQWMRIKELIRTAQA
jgi:TDG/mug DNA glycosylase family protein